jgi:crossover junction endodeoxyribonuclease RuvC
VGVDPGLAATGWGVIETDGQDLTYIAHGYIETKADCPRGERLCAIYTAFREVLDAYSPAESAMETLYFGRNVSSAMGVAEARGVLSLVLAIRGLPVREFTPNAIKQGVVGHSRGVDKSQVQEMIKLILNLKAIPRPDHAADALGAAVCAANTPIF